MRISVIGFDTRDAQAERAALAIAAAWASVRVTSADPDAEGVGKPR
jgi:hypothetical protein